MKKPYCLKCSFCKKSRHEVKTILAGNNNSFICNECVILCKRAIDDHDDSNRLEINLIPQEIYLLLNNYIIRQIGRAHVELQSHSDLVCRLLLEKKKKKKNIKKQKKRK